MDFVRFLQYFCSIAGALCLGFTYCTVRTVRNNNVVLAETELISYSRSIGIIGLRR